MGKKKGNTIILTLIILFIMISFIGCFSLFNTMLNKQIIDLTSCMVNDRLLEQKAYNFYLNNEIENDLFYIEDNTIYCKENLNIVFDLYIENDLINIKRRIK